MNENTPSYYSITPATVRYDEDLSPYARLLYGEISCLTNKEGYCFASNNYFANLYKKTPQAISKWINQLEKKGYIKTELIYQNKQVVERRIYINDVSIQVKGYQCTIDRGINTGLIGYQCTIKDNNTRDINTSNNIYNAPSKTEKKKKEFVAPSKEEIEAYCRENNYNIDIDYFIAYYSPDGKEWRDKQGKQVKNWKQRVVTWANNGKKFDAPRTGTKARISSDVYDGADW